MTELGADPGKPMVAPVHNIIKVDIPRRGVKPQPLEGTTMPIVTSPSNRETVEKYWQSVNARDWTVLAKLLDRDDVREMPQSGNAFAAHRTTAR